MSAGRLDPVEDGLRIIEAQRGVKAIQGGETEPSHGVGGFAQMTLVGRDQIATRIMRRWPDVVGRKLGAPCTPGGLARGDCAASSS